VKGEKQIFECKPNFMGVVYAEIELINTVDAENTSRHIIGEEEIRRMRLTMMVDSGAYMMAINETIQSQMDFPFVEKRKVQLASGQVVVYDVVGPIDVRFANRRAICTAFVLPGDSEPLLGAIPMEEMDVLIHPKRQELVVNPEYPNYAVLKMKGARKQHPEPVGVE
jgi:clan AA aspartic protease